MQVLENADILNAAGSQVLCVCVCVCACVYTDMHTYTFTYAYTDMHTHIDIQIHIHVHVHAHRAGRRIGIRPTDPQNEKKRKKQNNKCNKEHTYTYGRATDLYQAY